jgi:hypothetical protein
MLLGWRYEKLEARHLAGLLLIGILRKGADLVVKEPVRELSSFVAPTSRRSRTCGRIAGAPGIAKRPVPTTPKANRRKAKPLVRVESLEMLAEMFHPELFPSRYEGKGWMRYRAS